MKRKMSIGAGIATLVVLSLGAFGCDSGSNNNNNKMDGGSTDPKDSPFYPTELFQMRDAVKAASSGQGMPAATPLAVVPNAVAPYWTAAQIGAGRAASEVGAPVTFQGPASGTSTEQQTIVNDLVNSGYKGVSVSVLDPSTPETAQALQNALTKKVALITIDSDAAPGSGRLLYMGTNNYNAGVQAGKAMAAALGTKGGKIVGLVGYQAAQNAIDRISGINDGLAGSNSSMVEVYYDNTDMNVARQNPMDAMTKYADLAGFIGIYSYNGPAAAAAVQGAGKAIKIVTFDLQSDTQSYLEKHVITAAIGQRPYMMGYLSIYVLSSVAAIGSQATLTAMTPWLSGSNLDIVDTGIDVITAEQLPQYISFLQLLGIGSQ
jgi:ribose transport system substrate-binding protein